MNIRLYGENDTRPMGDYDFVKSAIILNGCNRIEFRSFTGKRIITTLRYRLTLEEGDKIDGLYGTGVSMYEKYLGCAKPPKEKKVSEHINNRPNSVKPFAYPDATATSDPRCDSTACPQPRPRRKAAARRDDGDEGNLFPLDPAGQDSD